MKTLPIILVVVAIIGILISVFPNFGFRSGFSGRNFNNTQIQQNPQVQIGFGFAGIFNFVRIGMWIVVLIIGVFLMREPKSKK